jgi:hypothetical protein
MSALAVPNLCADRDDLLLEALGFRVRGEAPEGLAEMLKC